MCIPFSEDLSDSVFWANVGVMSSLFASFFGGRLDGSSFAGPKSGIFDSFWLVDLPESFSLEASLGFVGLSDGFSEGLADSFSANVGSSPTNDSRLC